MPYHRHTFLWLSRSDGNNSATIYVNVPPAVADNPPAPPTMPSWLAHLSETLGAASLDALDPRCYYFERVLERSVDDLAGDWQVQQLGAWLAAPQA
jgi:hypothetical protein